MQIGFIISLLGIYLFLEKQMLKTVSGMYIYGKIRISHRIFNIQFCFKGKFFISSCI